MKSVNVTVYLLAGFCRVTVGLLVLSLAILTSAQDQSAISFKSTSTFKAMQETTEKSKDVNVNKTIPEPPVIILKVASPKNATSMKTTD